jgi:hypothetical protein
VITQSSIEEIVYELLEPYFSSRKIKLCKIIELSKEELEKISSKESYIFWFWLDRKCQNYPSFIFGQFSLQEHKITWAYREIEFLQWARMANKKDWFNRQDIREKELNIEVAETV